MGVSLGLHALLGFRDWGLGLGFGLGPHAFCFLFLRCGLEALGFRVVLPLLPYDDYCLITVGSGLKVQDVIYCPILVISLRKRMEGCQHHDPFLGTPCTRDCIITGTQAGTTSLTIYHMS